MSQNYNDISPTEKIYNSLSKLLERDETGVTVSAGTEFPQELEDWMIGRLCLRTDLKALYFLSEIDPITWTKILDFSQELATKSYVQSNYQPLNANLTALSNVQLTNNTILYCTSNTIAALPAQTYGLAMMSAGSASQARSFLQLGALATVNSITSSNSSQYIANNSISVSKLNFTPMTADQGYKTGDIKESYDSEDESGYITLGNDVSIGNTSSNATYTGNTYKNLYVAVWGNPAIKYFTSEGTETTQGESALVDWNALKYIVLPQGTNYINPNCYYKIKI